MLSCSPVPRPPSRRRQRGDRLGTGTIAKDGTVTLSGTYRCSSDEAYGTVVSTSVTSGTETSSVGSSVQAVCDGQEHNWTSQGRPYLPVQAGPVQAQASLIHLSWSSGSLIPATDLLAQQPQNTVLKAESAHS
ncbi:hypothetical protein GXW82_17630 [Streptacidiphilus sp. 4-A2]|nr:hypothetical protein [Streptacidiphilus sp. 4-A2]